MSRQTADEDIGYRRGVLLGFTISEMVLLLVFILLLTFGWIVWSLNDRLVLSEATAHVENDSRAAAEASLNECERYAREAADALETRDALVAKMLGTDHKTLADKFDDTFRELEVAKRE